MSYRVVDIKEYWASVVSDSLEFTVIADAENPEFNYLWEKIYGLVDEYFVKTATEYGVSRMEKVLKIVPLVTDTLEQRKERLIWKMNLKLPYTMRFLKNILTSMVGEENRQVEHDNDTQVLTIRIKDGLINKTNLRQDLEKIIPQNLVLRIGGEFNKDAFIIVGNPTITSSGVASGFKNNTYCRVYSDFYNNDNWEIKVAFSFSNEQSTGSLFSNPASYANMLFIDNGRISLHLSFDGNTIVGAYSTQQLKPNTVYIARLKYSSKNGYTVDISTNGNDWTNHLSISSTSKIFTNPANQNAWDLGVLANMYTVFTDGSIDLSQLSITVNDKEVLSGAY